MPGTDGKPGTWKYPLRWVYGDSISIFSPQASYPNDGGKGYANYKIVWDGGQPNETATDNNTAFLVKMGENGLHWGDLDEPHTFYAFYPKSFIDKDESFGTDIEHPSIVKGEIPKYQPMVKWEKRTEDENGTKITHWVGRPNMELCLMHATTTVTPSQIGADSPVQLDFKPLTTAVEVTLEADKLETSGADQLQTLHVRGMSKDGTQKQSISGNFSFDLNTGKAVSLDQDITNDYEITVPLWVEGTDGPEPLKLEDGDKVTLTVFLLPQEQGSTGLSENPDPANRTLTNLQLEVVNLQGATRLKSYDGVDIPHGTKSQIILPKYSPGIGSLNNWMSRIPSNTFVSQLTIPGATDAFSGKIITDQTYAGENDESDFTQTLSVQEQFNKGVRAFEIGTNRDLSSIACGNNSQSNFSLESVLDSLNTYLNYSKDENTGKPSEFVVVTLYYLYAFELGDINSSQGYSKWADNLNNKIASLKATKNVKAFSNNMTVGEARGNILLMIRTNGEEGVGKFSDIPTIEAWNNMKDKWKQRGYNVDNTTYFLTGDRYNQWNGSTNPNDVYTKPTLDNWHYSDSNNPNMSYYVQEWKRVCPKNAVYGYNKTLSKGSCTWYESFTEKKNNVIDFFAMTKERLQKATSANEIFINSLGGFYIINNAGGLLGAGGSSSAAPNSGENSSYGRTGNIASYSDNINTEIYKHMQSVSYDQRGPVGIVYFNFAGVEGYDDFAMHGDYLLKTLIGNNFSFPLLGASGK